MLIQGTYIADRYEIIGKIGAGGMSDVYKAKDLTLGRYVAIKVLKSEFSEDTGFVTKFRSEAQAAAGLEHPNIVNIYDVGSENGIHYIVMEYVEGITLKTYIEKKGQLSYKEAVSIAIQVGRGIEAAHNKNIIHRDIKPQNIMISTEGKVKVTDFGIARAASSNTISSDVMGSVHYSSPEQARNGFVDGKSDIYSLGIVMYEMVTGRVPFDGDTTVSVAIQHLQEEMVLPSVYAPDLPISIEKIILKCTQKSPDRRYESMAALLADLRRALNNPNEDFVVMAPAHSQDKTRVIGEEDIRKIKKQTGNVYLKNEPKEIPRQKASYEEEREYEEEYGEEDEEEDGDINPRLEKAITIMGIAAGVVIVILIAYIAYGLIGGFQSAKPDPAEKDTAAETESQPEKDKDTEQGGNAAEEGIPVPDLQGLSFEEAREILKGYELGIKEAGTAYSDTVEKDRIVSQQPEADAKVEKHTTIEVTLSSGKESIEIPDVVGETEDRAIRTLEENAFKFSKDYEYSSDVEAGRVISQSPEGGTQGKEGDEVSLIISKGEELVTVPDVTTTYKSEDQARELLADLTVSTDTKYSERAEGIVIGQSIPAGKQVAKGTDITITISLGPEPADVVPATTYKLNVRIELPEDTSNLSGADIVLYGKSGSVLGSWPGKTVEDFGSEGLLLTKTGMLESSGKLVITWLDLEGNDIGEQEKQVNFSQES